MQVYIETFGCSTNRHEAEVMAGLIARAGCLIVDSPSLADVIIINVCTVKGETKAQRIIRKMSNGYPDKALVVAGCIPDDYETLLDIHPAASMVSTHNISDIVTAVRKAAKGKQSLLLGKGPRSKVGAPKIRKNSIVSIIPVSTGCNSCCAYCSVKAIKGDLLSYKKEDLLTEARVSLSNGCKEIWLTSQDTATYGMDLGNPALPGLITDICGLPGRFYVRVGMMNPSNVLLILHPLIEAFRDPKVFKFLHVPLQSASPVILRKMGRSYSPDEFITIIDAFRKAIPDITISTDIICGFPTETDAQFNESLKMTKLIRPDVMNISRFKARPKTPAALMEQLDSRTIKNRSKQMTDLFCRVSKEHNRKWLGWTGEVLVDEAGTAGTSIARNFSYKQVILPGRYRLGQRLKVRITAVTSHDLRAEPQ
ncbi:MAG: tRNA (N(6)-L-threonylcarbamoyladenosine(37)-C(2))-methylthiotransferase [archaeon]